MPLFGSRQYLYGAFAFLDQLIGNEGQEIFALEGILFQVFGKEGSEAIFDLRKNYGMETPEIHGYHRAGRQESKGFPLIFAKGGAALAGLNMGAFHDAGKILVAFIHGAYAAGYAAVFGEGIFNQLTYHGRFIFGMVFGEEIVHNPISLCAVKVISIDDGKGGVDLILGA